MNEPTFDTDLSFEIQEDLHTCKFCVYSKKLVPPYLACKWFDSHESPFYMKDRAFSVDGTQGSDCKVFKMNWSL